MSDSRKDLPPASSSAFLERTREALSTYLGLRGDKLDMGITLRHLVDAGITKLNPGFLTGGRRNPIGGVGPAVVDAYELDLTPPPTPTGFTATAAISNVLVESAAQLYTMGHGHAKSVVYGKEWVSGPLPIFTDARVITEFQGTVASYATNPSTTWHLWLKWVSVDGVASATPAGGTNGFAVTTGLDVDALVSAMTGPGNPFTILTVDTVIDGVTYPAGTYTTKALIMDAQISSAKIKLLAVDNGHIANLNVSKLTAGSLAVGQYIQSTSYVAGTSGWRINADGTAELANATVRGSIYATAGYLQGVEVRNSAGTVLLNAGDTANDVRNSAIVVGGRNLLPKSATFGTMTGFFGTASVANGILSTTGAGATLESGAMLGPIAGRAGVTYTASVWVQSSGLDKGVMLPIFYDGAWRLYNYFSPVNFAEYTQISVTFTPTIAGDVLIAPDNYRNVVGGTATFKWPKIELGNKATDWTPAPEDVDAGIAGAATTANYANLSGTPDTSIANSTLVPSIQAASVSDNLWTGSLATITSAVGGASIISTGYTDPRGNPTGVVVRLPVAPSYIHYNIMSQAGRAAGWYVITLRLYVVAGMSIVVSATDGSSWNSSEYKIATTTSTTPVWVGVSLRQYVVAGAAGLDVVVGSFHGPSGVVSSTPSFTEVAIADLTVYADGYVGVSNATANQSDATTNNAIATKLNNAGANVMNSGFFLQTNGYAGGNGVALYDGGLIGKKGGVNQFTLDTGGNAYFGGELMVGIATAVQSASQNYAATGFGDVLIVEMIVPSILAPTVTGARLSVWGTTKLALAASNPEIDGIQLEVHVLINGNIYAPTASFAFPRAAWGPGQNLSASPVDFITVPLFFTLVPSAGPVTVGVRIKITAYNISGNNVTMGTNTASHLLTQYTSIMAMENKV